MTATAVDHRAVIARFQAGDRGAYADLYTAYHGMVFQYVHRRVPSREHAEDLTQDVFVKALRRLDGWQDQGSDPGAWLVTIARNRIADHYKSAPIRTTSSVGVDFAGIDHVLRDTAVEAGPEGEVLDRRRDLALLEALACLTAVQRQVILHRFVREMSVTETARAMGRTEPVVKSLQFRAVRSMRRHFDGRSWL